MAHNFRLTTFRQLLISLKIEGKSETFLWILLRWERLLMRRATQSASTLANNGPINIFAVKWGNWAEDEALWKIPENSVISGVESHRGDLIETHHEPRPPDWWVQRLIGSGHLIRSIRADLRPLIAHRPKFFLIVSKSINKISLKFEIKFILILEKLMKWSDLSAFTRYWAFKAEKMMNVTSGFC